MRSLVLLLPLFAGLALFAGCGSPDGAEPTEEVSQPIDTGKICGRNGVTCGTVDCNNAADAKYCTECGAGQGAIDCCKIYTYCTVIPPDKPK